MERYEPSSWVERLFDRSLLENIRLKLENMLQIEGLGCLAGDSAGVTAVELMAPGAPSRSDRSSRPLVYSRFCPKTSALEAALTRGFVETWPEKSPHRA